MALSSAKVLLSRDKSPSRSPLSPTIIHYRQKYPIPRISQDFHREIKRHHHHLQKQPIQNTSRQHHQNRRRNKNFSRQPSPINSLWEIHKSSNGQIYYYNVVTDRSQWEKPPKEQLLSSSITKKPLHSKRSSNNNNDFNSFRSPSSHIHHRSINKINRIKTITRNNHHHKRRKNISEIKSSFKKFRKDKKQTDEIILSTPASPPANEKIQIDLVDPILTPTNSITNNSIPLIDSQQSHYQISSIDSKRSIKNQINEDLSSMINQSSLCPSESTINAILELEHSSPVLSIIPNLNSDHITRYYRAELIQHLLNWPSTQIEREAIRLSNEQIRFTTCQLTSLRTDLFSLRLKFERNRCQLLKYHYTLVNQQDLLGKLQLIDSDQI